MSHILIVGQKFSSLTDYLDDHGHTYMLLQDDAKTKYPEKRIKHRVVMEFSDQQTILDAVDQLKKPVDAVISTYENYILPTAWIAKHLGLPGLPIATAEACTDKYLMRSLFAKAPEKISPAFMTVNDENDIRKFAADHGFPIILKPANLAKSLLVTKSNSLDELVKNYRRSTELLQTTYQKYAPNRTPKLIIEEFMQGSIHSVDAFITADGTPHVLDQIVDYQTGYDIGYDDNFHYSRLLPSKLSAESQASLIHCAEIGIRALGMKNSPAHVEIIMTPKGPRIVEIGARNGGYRERMHRIANGIDITGAALSLALGKPHDAVATRNNACAVLELFPKIPGAFVGISHIQELVKLDSLEYFNVKVENGEYIGKAADGYKMTAVIMLHNSDSQKFAHDLAYIENHCHVITT